MSNDDDAFVFRNWANAPCVVSDAEGPFGAAEIELGLRENSLVGEVKDIDLVLPDLETFVFGNLEEIATEAPSVGSSDNEHIFAEPTEEDPWTIPEVLKVGSEPKFRTWDAFLNPNHHEARPSLLSEAGPRVFDAVLSERCEGDDLVIDSTFVLRCIALLAQGQSSPLFSRQASGSGFSTFDNGRFRASGLSDAALKSLVQKYKSIGEKTVDLLDYVDRTFHSKRLSVTQIALATCLRTLLEADRRRTSSEASTLRSFIQLQALFEKTACLLNLLHQLQNTCSSAIDEGTAVNAVLAELSQTRSSHPLFAHTIKAIAIAMSRPTISRLLSALGLCHKDLSDAEATDELLEHLSSTDADTEHKSSVSRLLSDTDRHSVQDIIQGLDVLRKASSDHPLVLGEGQPLLRGLVADDLHDPDPNAILQKAQQYEQAVLNTLNDANITSATHFDGPVSRSTNEDGYPSIDHDELYTEAFTSLGNQFTQPPDTQGSLDNDSLTKAYAVDIHTASQPDTLYASSLAEDDTILAPLRPLLTIQASLTNHAVLQHVFHHSKFLQHLSLLHSHSLFASPSFILRLSTALFSSLSPSPRTLASSAPGLRLDAHTTRWPPTTSDLRLSLANILTTSTTLPTTLSFALRPLSALPDLPEIMDPTSPSALSFLRLQYTAPPPLAPLFPDSIMATYDIIFSYLLSLLRAQHTTTSLSSLLSRHPRSKATAFAHQAHHILSVLTSHMFDLGIAPTWSSFISTLNEIKSRLSSYPATSSLNIAERERALPSLSALLSLHTFTLEGIAERLFLAAGEEQVRAKKAVEGIIRAVLRGHALLAAGTDRLATTTTDVEGEETAVRVGELTAELTRGITELGAALEGIALTPGRTVRSEGARDGRAMDIGVREGMEMGTVMGLGEYVLMLRTRLQGGWYGKDEWGGL
ncbi:hypothetical protein K461DRAFT_320527 [Myriangium duriaei CBS 260.36]|uniref:Spindle pole body component n=1 Tax=Myriangium duriaei CBS 260.36 TaxID=1168546 RepID=A0A9P4J4E9_9PEZI|nr:hypothetical protein K461DRAFT_320527 [Myriangium duriaei CBS 260.36]